MAFEIEEGATTGFLEEEGASTTSLFDIYPMIAALPDGDLTFGDINNTQTAIVVGNFAAKYGFDPTSVNVASVTSRGSSDISQAIPEPSSIALLGLGLLGMSSLKRIRK